MIMELVVNALASDIAGRIVSCAMENFLRPSPPAAQDAHRRRLEQLLDNIGSAVEEAEGRCITNLHLLAQLKMVNDAMYRGRFALEAAMIGDDAGDDSVSSMATTTAGKRKFALGSLLNAAKRARLILGGGDGGVTTEKSLATVVEELEALRSDYMLGFIQLAQGYPRRTNKVPRPLTTTLFMDRCVFGRHVETERVVAFLLQVQRTPPRATGLSLSVLAVVGAKKVGKTTLVKHVCDDERVRDHFARIEWFNTWDVLVHAGWHPGQTEWLIGRPKYHAGVRRILHEPRRVGRSLLVFEDALPVDESVWAALLATSKLSEGSKLLFTCRDADLGRILGTVEPMLLQPLQEEEYWFYFKAFVFGGTELRDHPRMAAVAREISRRLESRFLDARLFGPLLRANFNARFWRRVLIAIVESKGLPNPLHVGILLNLLQFSSRMCDYWWHGSLSPPKFTVQDVLDVSAATSSGPSSLGNGDADETITIHYCRETLYMDHWYTITFKKDDLPLRLPHAVNY